MREKIIENRWIRRFFIMAVCFYGAFLVTVTGKAAGDQAYERQVAADLLKNGKFAVSGNGVSVKENEKAKGVMIQGKAEDMSQAVFTFTDAFTFGKDQAGYLLVDALAERKKNIKLAFYLDNEKEPFATVAPIKQKKDDLWSTVKNRCTNLEGKNVTGTHRLSFRVITEETGKLSMAFRSVTFIKSDIPTVEFNLDESQGLIDSMNNDKEHDTECYGNMTLRIPEGYKSEYTDKACETQTYALDYIRGRGNSTWSAPKKPYKLKLDKKQDLLGMGANKHWVLLANYYDVSMLRNKITYWLGSQLGMEFTPKCEFVNVVMNGEYLGSYYLCEHVRVGKTRVNIDDLEEDEASKNATDEKTISGGYLLSLCPDVTEEKQKFTTDRQNSFLIESPSFEDYLNEAQVNYIKNYVQKTENAIYGKDFKDESGISYQDYMDIDSAIDYYWIQEVSLNGDGFLSNSSYLYKKRDGKLYWGPLWDFDYVAWGATEYTRNLCTGFEQNGRVWYDRLFQDPVFYNRAVERWKTVREKILEACEDGGQIDKYSARQYESQRHNYEIWEKYSDSYLIWDEALSPGSVTYDSEVTRLKEWMRERVAWIDDNLSGLKQAYNTVSFMVDDRVVSEVQVRQGMCIDELPEEPEKDGYIFDGWYLTMKYNGEEYEYPFTYDTDVTKDITVRARWKERKASLPISKLAFAMEQIYIGRYDTALLNASVMPFEADSSGLVWKSSAEDIVTVNEDGMVTSQNKNGSAVVTVTAPGGASAECRVNVLDYEDMMMPIGFCLQTKELSVKEGEYASIKVSMVPEQAMRYRTVSFASSDESIVKVDGNGCVCGIRAGSALVAVSCSDFGMRFCKVTVTKNGGDLPSDTPVKKGTAFTVQGIKYKVLSVGAEKKVACAGLKNKNQSKVTVPGTVKYRGVTYQVTEIAKRAFANCKKLVQVKIGKKVTKIRDEAFANCRKLKKLVILSDRLQSAGKNVLKGTSPGLKLTAGKGKKAKYQRMLGIKK